MPDRIKASLNCKKIHVLGVAIKKLKAYLKLFFLLQDEKGNRAFSPKYQAIRN